jgi:hypothetical protein
MAPPRPIDRTLEFTLEFTAGPAERHEIGVPYTASLIGQHRQDAEPNEQSVQDELGAAIHVSRGLSHLDLLRETRSTHLR